MAETKKIQRMADEIQHLVTRPGYSAAVEDLKAALEEMAKAVGLFAEEGKKDALVFIEGNVNKAYEVIIERRRSRMYVDAVEVNSGC